MAIIDDFDAIAKRLRELQSPAAKSVDEIGELEKWRDLARETARVYLANRRRSALGNGRANASGAGAGASRGSSMPRAADGRPRR